MSDVRAFALLSGDDNPIHVNREFAAGTRFGKPIVHGMLYGSMFGTMIGASIDGAVYVNQTFGFKKPVFVGQSVTGRIEVQSLSNSGRVCTCSTIASVDDVVVMEGEAVFMLPKPIREDAQ